MFRSVYHFIRVQKNRALNLFDPPVIVLIYHRVTTLESDPHLLAVNPENFRDHMQFLKNNYPVLRLEDNWSDARKPSVVITFDDGYADNALQALSVLDEVGVPATFFVTTGSVDTKKEFWWDELERLILGEWNFSETFLLDDNRFGRQWTTITPSQRNTMYQELHLLMKKVEDGRREGWLTQLRKWVKAVEKGRASHLPMSVEELRKAGQSRWVTIGAHTVTHSPLSILSYQQQKAEIVGSKKQLETWLGYEVKMFSYPFGMREDYNKESIRLCREAGFSKAASNFPGQVHRWTDPYQIPRHIVRNWPVEIFAEKLGRFWY